MSKSCKKKDLAITCHCHASSKKILEENYNSERLRLDPGNSPTLEIEIVLFEKQSHDDTFTLEA